MQTLGDHDSPLDPSAAERSRTESEIYRPGDPAVGTALFLGGLTVWLDIVGSLNGQSQAVNQSFTNVGPNDVGWVNKYTYTQQHGLVGPGSTATKEITIGEKPDVFLRGNRSMDWPFGVEVLSPKDERRAKRV